MPSTFQMPEALEDEAPADELQKLIDEENEEPADHPTEPDCNEFGVFVRNVESIVVPMKKAWKTECRVEVAKATDGRWFAGYHFKGGSAAPSMGEYRKPWRSRVAAVMNTLDWMLSTCRDLDPKTGDTKIGKEIAKFMQQWERDNPEEITAPDCELPPHDAETQEAAEDLKSCGIDCGQAGEPTVTITGTEPNSDQAVADFKARLHAAVEDLGACVLRRMDTEAQFKQAKADQKAAEETLQKLTSRGVERMPLFDAPLKVTKNAPAAPPRESDAWKQAPLTELGLPKGLADKLEGDGITTIGRLEQRRADVCNKREKWPKGVGKAAIDKIEDAQLKWIAENRDTWQPPAPVESPKLDERLNSSTMPCGIAANDPDSIGDVVARANWLANQDGIRDEESPAYFSGAQAFAKGDQLADCPYVPATTNDRQYINGSDQDQWLYGWIDTEAERDDADDSHAEDTEASE